MPIVATPGVVAFFGEQLWCGTGQEVGHKLLSLSPYLKDLVERWHLGPKDRQVEAHLGCVSEYRADLVEGMLYPHDPDAEPGVGYQHEVAQGLSQRPLVIDVGINQRHHVGAVPASRC